LLVFIAAWLPGQAAGAANSPTFRDCSFVGGLDPDFVLLSGASVGPGGTLTVTSSQRAVTVEASESSDPGDNLGHDTFTVTATGSGGRTQTVSGMGTGHVTLSVPLSGVAPGGQYSLNWSAVFDSGFHPCPGSMDPQNMTSNPFVLHVVAGAAPAAPVITNVRESHRRWREKRVAGSRVPVGTSFSFNLSEPAHVRLVFKHKLRSGRLVSQGTISRAGVAGTNKLHFDGRIPGRRRLAPGHYVLMITATNAAGEAAAPRSIAFTIVG
jgi:hypothetical protein